MIHCEEKLLRFFNASIQRYAAKHPDNKSFFAEIGTLNKHSLQNASLAKDFEYFNEINKLLGVFVTIVTHPYVINERETVILRAEQAHGLTPEMFMQTVREQKLWKDKRGVMTPSEVYYFRNVDELKNYENRFIVHLIDIVSAQISEYLKFYDFLVGTVMNGNVLTKDDSTLDKAYEKTDALSRKIRRIKETDFYKIVSRANTSFTHIEATNVFKHNRAYAACYRFYINNVTYRDEKARSDELVAYFYVKLLGALKRAGYKLRGNGKSVTGKVIRKMKFESEDFTVTVDDARKYSGLSVKFSHKQGENVEADNLLVFDGETNFGHLEENIGLYENLPFTAVDAISVWDVAYVEDKVVPLNAGRLSEIKLLGKYIEEKTKTIKGSRRIYETHCPVCGSKDIVANQSCECSFCGTKYTFVGDKIWLTKLRKR